MTETDEAKRLRVHQLWQAKLDADIWNGWRALLSGWEIEGVKVPVDPNTPFTGYYRSRNVDKTFVPVAYWFEDGKVVCLRNGHEVDEEKAIRDWPYVSRYPISHAWYKLVAEDRRPWPDADARVTSEALKVADKPVPKEPKMGDNNPPEETPVMAIRNKIDNAKGGIVDYAVIKSEEQLSKAKSLKNRLTELSGEAKKERDALSRPHLDALESIRDTWTPLVDDAAASAKTINNAMDAYETAKLKAMRADEARVAAEQAEAERVKRANEERLKQAAASGDSAELEKVPEVKTTAPTTPPVNTKVTAAYGRAGSVKTEWIVTEITDAAELFKFLTTPKIHSELKAMMIALAQRAKAAGFDPPGVSMEERAKVRG